MKTRIINAEDNIVTRWSGGTTSQVYIYPENAVYAERNFLFRLSMANAEVDNSVYTQLAGVKRYLVALEGESDIIHEKDTVHLAPFGIVDCFSGEEHTEAHGAIRDFNLMLKDGADGDMSVVTSENITIDSSFYYYAIYVDTDLKICCDKDTFSLKKGDCLLVSDVTSPKNLHLDTLGSAILCRIAFAEEIKN